MSSKHGKLHGLYTYLYMDYREGGGRAVLVIWVWAWAVLWRQLRYGTVSIV